VGKGIGKKILISMSWIWIGGCTLLFSWETACAGDARDLLNRHSFAIGIDVSYLDNEEEGVGDRSGPEWDGWMYGLVAGYTYHNHVMMEASLDYSMGDLDYDGALRTFSPSGEVLVEPSKKEADSEVLECRGLLGYDFIFRDKHVVTPFLGLGYRYWSEDRSGRGGFEREVEYWYSPLGIRTCSPLSGKWTWGATLEYDHFWDGKVDSDLSGMPTFHFDSGYGTRFSLRFGRALSERVALSLEPYVTYWDIDESDVELFAIPSGSDEFAVFPSIEPDNDTSTFGLRMRLEF
jgi:hypothetical protein